MFSNGMFFIWVIGIVIIALSFWIFLKILSRPKNPADEYSAEDSPADILKKRLAKGEITREEYEETLKRFK